MMATPADTYADAHRPPPPIADDDSDSGRDVTRRDEIAKISSYWGPTLNHSVRGSLMISGRCAKYSYTEIILCSEAKYSVVAAVKTQMAGPTTAATDLALIAADPSAVCAGLLNCRYNPLAVGQVFDAAPQLCQCIGPWRRNDGVNCGGYRHGASATPPGAAQAAQAYPSPPQQQYYASPPPASSTPPNQAQFYHPPPSQSTPSPSYPPPPQQHQSTPSQSSATYYPPPPPSSQPASPPPQQYSAPPQHTPSPSLQYSGQAQQYPSPPHTSSPPPAQQHAHHQQRPSQSSIPLRTASAGIEQQPQQTPPPQFDAPPPSFPPTESGYPDEKQQLKLKQQEEERQQAAAAAAASSSSSSNNATHQTSFTEATQGAPPKFISGAPPAELFQGATATTSDDVGTFNGGSYRISHRDCNTILTIQLAVGCPVHAKPGAMFAMSPTIISKGSVKLSVKKLIAGADVGTSTFTGPGELLLAPHMLGDISTLRLYGNETWSVGHDAYLASTQAVVKDYKRQGLGKAMFSGEGLWVNKISGKGLLWMCSFGAIIRKDLIEGEKYLVDNGHLVAWNCKYVLERVSSGGIISGFAASEGLVCKFTGPGIVYIQSRNAKAFSAYMQGQAYQG
ncbi:Pfam:DUF124 [Geosmithia morbida]|uniref:Altered inheritance of mitochondria protein 24, mitochondrial n=1 Tax=Geosmithia morbida TaxID=1094350 RepID=A0A9P4Z322_9HYPO|nr:Pfam:DUF124 [Geosmithia morbida]KAF4125729.1 Pfam:DUF124 [Geosmithia morbida]